MKISIGGILTTAGATVAVMGVIAMAIGLKFSTPGGVLTLLVYKGIFAAAVGLMVAGAVFGRLSHRRRAELEAQIPPQLDAPMNTDDFAPLAARQEKAEVSKKVY